MQFPSTIPPLSNYRAITACFEALPGRVIPVDLAPVTITAPMLLATGELVDAPCDLPESIPELFNVRNADPAVADLGPICTFNGTDTCSLEVRGRNFGPSPDVSLGLPEEQLASPQAGPGKVAPVVDVISLTIVNRTSGDHHYDSVRERTGIY
jgi:hypothetical protein